MNIQAKQFLSNIDWWVTENVDTICVYDPTSKKLRHLNATEKIIPVFTPEFQKKEHTIRILMPIQRYGELVQPADIPTKWTIQELLGFIHDFYDSAIDSEKYLIDMKNNPSFHSDEYFECVQKNIAANIPQKMFNLIGSNQVPPFINCSLDPENRRHPFFCSGKIRFEDLHFGKTSEGKFQVEIALGS